MTPFAYARAATLEDALAASPAATFLAGGTELLNWMRLGIATPERLLDISRIEGLDGIEALPGGGLKIGALARLGDIASHESVARDFPALAQAIEKSASGQLRNLATLGGNLLQKTRCAYFRAAEDLPCNKRRAGSGCAARHGLNGGHAILGWSEACVATHPSDPAVALAALDAVLNVRSRDGARRIAVADFHLLDESDPSRDNALMPGEIVTSIELPSPAPRSAYLKVRERESYEFATLSVAVTLTMEHGVIASARIAFGAVAHKPWRFAELEARLAGLAPGSVEVRAAVAASLCTARALAHNGYKVKLAENAATRLVRDVGALP